ncbi:MAG TPA: hypothetical protein VIM52_00665 [Stellaceae bacterium]
MTKRGFRNLFLRALRTAAEIADIRLAQRAPRSFLIELHAPNSAGQIMSVDEAADQIYLGSDKFYRIIDVSIPKISSDQTIAFVRVSGHQPGPFSDTWDPANLGPFKQIFSQTIEDQRVRA